jgi:hypothetical protein
MRESNLRERNAFSEWTIRADDADHRIARAVRTCVGNHIREMYGEVLREPIPPKLAGLLLRLDRRRAAWSADMGSRQNIKHYRELLLRDDLSDTKRHRLLSVLSLIQKKEVLAKIEQNAQSAASAKTFKDRDFYERMHKKWLAIADERQIQLTTIVDRSGMCFLNGR